MRRGWLILSLALLAACRRTPAESGNDAGKAVTLVSASITLPGDPASPVLGERTAIACTACHSAELIASQPPLAADKWAAEVKKMREAYHAAIAPADDAALVAELVAMQRHGVTPAR